MRKTGKQIIFLLMLGLMLLSGCHLPAKDVNRPISLEQIHDQIKSTLANTAGESNINQGGEKPTQLSEQNADNSNESIKIYLHPGLPFSYSQIFEEKHYSLVNEEEAADIKVKMGPFHASDHETLRIEWIYVLAAPFYTILDDVNFQELSELWRGERGSISSFSRIYVTETTKAAVSTILGMADDSIVNVLSKEEMDDIPLSENQSLIILPFEDLNKKLKVILIDGEAPINTNFDPQNYSLSVAIWIETDLIDHNINLPESNYDPGLRTILVMTGVTALTRATAHRMEIMGNQYPGQDIRDWLTSADLTHISNEVPFAANCPQPDPVQQNLIFCSSPDRIELLEYVGADIIELSGNHLLDYGLEAVNLTLDMYEERDWVTYAGGWDLADSRSPALIDHNGNRLAFIGCNSVGPPNAWASTSKPGAAPCGDFSWMTDEIENLQADGYLPIVTLQYAEDYTAYPSAQMAADFQMLASAGAVIVNGSQAHTPKMMAFQDDSFLHYGLGNLFFDQMEVYYNDVYLSGTRDEFIDRLIFYDGELISIELLSALLEDYARPRPMTAVERSVFLSRIFSTASDFNE
jgi:poly-gamma-glutamate synthesis protein (capsule biosynthesis protein)